MQKILPMKTATQFVPPELYVYLIRLEELNGLSFKIWALALFMYILFAYMPKVKPKIIVDKKASS